jgi:hypothetical protein
MSGSETRIPGVGTAAPSAPAAPAGGGSGDLTEELLQASVWTDDMLARAGIPIRDVPFVSVGGGVGSFVMADYLRIAGVPTSHIRVLTNIDVPWQTYEYLTKVSQIPRSERLRSDSTGMPDNIWGFPSYAFREAAADKSLAPLWNVLTEPIFTDYYTPRAGQVFEAMEKEARRIDWWSMLDKGLVRMTRKRWDGGYFTILTPPAGTSATKRVAYRSWWVHVAVGYPGVRFLPDLQEYRQRHQDYVRVVNAYEPHEHVYEELMRHPGKVLLRGGGIVASRVLQRLIDDRETRGAQTQIIHLFRTYVTSSHGPSPFMRRKGSDGWAYQGFNWPKGTWGGQLKFKMEKLEGEERKKLYQVMGGTNTPKRKLWQQQLKRGREQGFYHTVVGEVQEVVPAGDGTIITRIRTPQTGQVELPANYIIDATGLEADIAEHRLFADLLTHSGAGRNVMNRLDVERSFELRGTRSGAGRMYASGSPTLGGYYCGVDSFLGLQYAALQITDDLARQGFCQRIGTGRSVSQWWKWARNREPGS